MKRIVVLSCVMVWGAMTSFGESIAVTPSAHPVSQAKGNSQKSSTNNIVAAQAVPAPNTLVNKTELRPEDLARFRKIQTEKLLVPEQPERDYGATLASIFRLENENVGDTRIDSAYLTLFPTGH